jgi:hypothetical protein
MLAPVAAAAGVIGPRVTSMSDADTGSFDPCPVFTAAWEWRPVPPETEKSAAVPPVFVYAPPKSALPHDDDAVRVNSSNATAVETVTR